MKRNFAILLFCVLIFGSCGSGGPLVTSLSSLYDYEYDSSPIKDAEFSTKYNENIKNRTTNLKIACQTINDIIIMPGEIFSFNDTIGKATAEKGYKPAKIFLKGKEIEGIGGGICQVSSTLYNAADNAGFKIIERHAHSKPVYYVKKDRDAATAYGSVDLKIQNEFNFPVKIVCFAEKGKLLVRLERII